MHSLKYYTISSNIVFQCKIFLYSGTTLTKRVLYSESLLKTDNDFKNLLKLIIYMLYNIKYTTVLLLLSTVVKKKKKKKKGGEGQI
jgi:hypothetical protein